MNQETEKLYEDAFCFLAKLSTKWCNFQAIRLGLFFFKPQKPFPFPSVRIEEDAVSFEFIAKDAKVLVGYYLNDKNQYTIIKKNIFGKFDMNTYDINEFSYKKIIRVLSKYNFIIND